jgi:hypothetical protein
MEVWEEEGAMENRRIDGEKRGRMPPSSVRKIGVQRQDIVVTGGRIKGTPLPGNGPMNHRKKEDVLPPELFARQSNASRTISLFHWDNFIVYVYLCITVLALFIQVSYRKLCKNLY